MHVSDVESQHAKSEHGKESSSFRSISTGSEDLHASGVSQIQSISSSFTTASRAVLFVGIFLVAYAYGLDGQTRYTYQSYATAGYSQHSLLGTMNTVRAICAAVIQPPYARVADRFGRIELLSFALFFYLLGTVIVSSSNGVDAFVTGQLLYQIGYTGLMLLIEVLIADLTGLKDRVLFSFLPALPFLINTWVSGDITQAVMGGPGWKWGIGMWCIIIPFCAIPIFAPLYLAKRTAKQQGKLNKQVLFKAATPLGVFKELAEEIDLVGSVLLAASFTLILLPLTLAGGAKTEWKTAKIIVMLVIGAIICVPLFVVWEVKFARYPCIPFSAMANRTILCGMVVAMGLNMSWYLQGDFLYTVLVVAFDQSIRSATRISSLYSFTSVITGVIVGFLVRHVRYIKPFAVAGTLVFILAMGLLVKYRTDGGNAGVAGMIGAQVVLGVGGGLFAYPVQALVQAASSHEMMATMTALYLTFYQIGSALGNAVSTAIWTQTLPGRLTRELGNATLALSVYADPFTFASTSGWETAERQQVVKAYGETQRLLAITGICLSLVTLIAALGLRNYKVDERQSLSEEERKGKVVN